MARVLIVDDEKSLRDTLGIALEDEGYTTLMADSAEQAFDVINKHDLDVVLTDLRMPGLDGLEVLDFVNNNDRTTQVIVLTAYGTTETAVEAMKKGAYDYLTKPYNLDEVKVLVRRAIERRNLDVENSRLKQQLKSVVKSQDLIFISENMREIQQLIERIADRDITVLVTGESGVGKEVIAQAIHRQGRRTDYPFVPVNCGALPENLIESELFGYEKGAFTGADQAKAGLLEQANGGTLFLDEISELPMFAQVKILRILQEQKVRRLGAAKERDLDLRIISATNRALKPMVENGSFREDLYYRLNVFELDIPPLRERKEDIPILFEHFCRQAAQKMATKIDSISEDVYQILRQYSFPGNIRELQNIAERAVILARDGEINLGTLPSDVRDTRQQSIPESDFENIQLYENFNLEDRLEEIERAYYEKAIEQADGVKTNAAELLGLSFRQFRYKAKKYKL